MKIAPFDVRTAGTNRYNLCTIVYLHLNFPIKFLIVKKRYSVSLRVVLINVKKNYVHTKFVLFSHTGIGIDKIYYL